MTGCTECGAPCGHYARCQTHRLSRRHDDDPQTDGGTQTDDDTVEVECTDCGAQYDHIHQDGCPSCDGHRRRYVGPLDDTDDRGDETATVVDSEAVLAEVDDD